ncbi:hemolysin XhlA family protein [Clostridium beijerinckii]|nr:hemolysin XhlA family protein [Clostridium beijerinckii]MBA8936505.1 peptidoglycan hydrolase CwlO-like protein [Clostridium beijerinckii]NRT33266.1 peptidoglycan hydrolase CwlO-like protein [Clostridium beijerinckii]NRT47308.1 peptidoglycan hydrolase CwlO-like protein [Clostridium beijerinckii]NRU41027.1 peptidoglycan hydrolase CwlO-like protein [Clostridium beijerinckii]NRZ18687.1 peptidoglycan hydrolase CwlO-like protein [Clostridium beijerinckii]
MNEELVKDKIETHERRLNNHGERIDKLEQDGRELKTELKNLCENLKNLTSMMKWFITAMGGALISFFFYAVQTGIFNK